LSWLRKVTDCGLHKSYTLFYVNVILERMTLN